MEDVGFVAVGLNTSRAIWRHKIVRLFLVRTLAIPMYILEMCLRSLMMRISKRISHVMVIWQRLSYIRRVAMDLFVFRNTKTQFKLL